MLVPLSFACKFKEDLSALVNPFASDTLAELYISRPLGCTAKPIASGFLNEEGTFNAYIYVSAHSTSRAQACQRFDGDPIFRILAAEAYVHGREPPFSDHFRYGMPVALEPLRRLGDRQRSRIREQLIYPRYVMAVIKLFSCHFSFFLSQSFI